RRMVARGFIEAGDEMRAARTGRARAHAEPAGQLRLSRGGERGAFFVAHADPLDRAVAADRVAQRIQRIADQAENLPNPDLFEYADQDICDHLSHLCSSLLRWLGRETFMWALCSATTSASRFQN